MGLAWAGSEFRCGGGAWAAVSGAPQMPKGPMFVAANSLHLTHALRAHVPLIRTKEILVNSLVAKTRVAGRYLALATLTALVAQMVEPAQAQEAQGTKPAMPGLSRQPSAAAQGALLDPNDTVVLLLDHQTGLF